MKKQRIVYVALISLLVLAVMVPVAGAFETYSTNRSTGNCADCHGNFRAAPYISNHDGVQWALGLHDAHRNTMLSGDCNVCHAASGRYPVSTFSSAGGTGFQAIGCSGCHDGDGLRAHHENSGAAQCYGCHNAAPPPAENVKPPYYFTPDTAHPNKPTDPCNLNGTESALAPPLGLDNDGNLLYDQNDPACVAAAAKISVTPTALSFGNQAVTVTSAAQTVTISNTGTASLSVTGIANSNATDFIVTAPATPFSVAAGGSQTFTVAFKPGSTGAKSTTISITSNGGNATVSGAGTGVSPRLGVSPTTLAFGNQTVGTTSAAQTVTISNTGTGTLNVTGITSSNAEFTFSPNTIAPIAAGGTATLSLRFVPTPPAGAKSATISITSTGGNATVSATGTSVAEATQPVLSIAPSSLTFSNVTAGAAASKTVTITNTGNAPLNVTNITQTGSATFGFSPVSVTPVAAGANATLTITYAPTAAGFDSGSIDITSDGGNGTISLSGTAVTAAAGDVSLVKLTFPEKVSMNVKKGRGTEVRAYSYATADALDAKVTLSATGSAGVRVKIDNPSVLKKLTAGQQKKVEYEAKIRCAKPGTWPVTWTAKISSVKNSDPANDTLTGTTQVICSSDSREHGEEDD